MFHIFLQLVGIDTSTVLGQDMYNFVSGPLPDITLFGGIYALYSKHKCSTCWRIGHLSVEGTPYKTCIKHSTEEDHNTLQKKHKLRFFKKIGKKG